MRVHDHSRREMMSGARVWSDGWGLRWGCWRRWAGTPRSSTRQEKAKALGIPPGRIAQALRLTFLTTVDFGVEYWPLARMIAPSLGGVTPV
jgi:hypothetical protein